MRSCSEPEIAWMAGIYEGEGSCTLRGKTSLRVEIMMADHDIIERFHDLSGVGTVRGPVIPKQPNAKPILRFSVGSLAAVELLETILPWLGKRRKTRAEAAIKRWREGRVQMRPTDTHCIHGHEMTESNTALTYGGRGRVCRTCRNAASRRYKKKKTISPTL